MQPQAFLDGFRSARGMGMANTRNRFDRSADQDQTQSGNPGTIYNQAQFKAPSQSFHQQDAFANAQQALGQVPVGGAQGFAMQGGADPAATMMGGRFPMARTRGGMPGQIGQMTGDMGQYQQRQPSRARGFLGQQEEVQPVPSQPPPGAQFRFNAPRFNTNQMLRGRQMNQ
jgi:hypothetical protein